MVRRIISVMLAAALLSGSFGAVYAQDSGAVVLYPQAEIFVQSNNNRNFKDEPTVLAGRGRFPYIKFDLEPYMGKTVLSAVLKCYKTDVNKSVLGVFEVPDTSFTDDMVYQTRPDLPVVTPSANESAVPAIDNSLALIRATAPGKACAFEIDMTSMLRKCSGDKFAFMLYPVDIGVPGGSSIYANSIVKGRENPDYTADKRLRLEVTFTDDPDEITVINDMDKINLGDLSAVTEDIALPAVGESGETEITWESSSEYITADGKVTRPDYIEGDADVTLTATVTKNTVSMQKSFSATVLRKSLTDKERIALDSEALRLYDGITTVRNLDFIKTGEYGTVFTYESSDPRFLDEDGVVTRPGSEETSAAVTVTVTAECGDITEVFTLNIYIPKQQLSNTETMCSSFNDVYGYVKNWTADKTEGTLPGQYPQGSFAKLSEDADYIFENCDKTSYTALSAGIKDLSSILKELIASAVTSDKVVDEENNGLEFSEYRISLMQDVAEGEIALLTEPDMYTKSAKIALKDYADYCKSVLDGTYKRPFTRNRDFLKPRPDEAIQFASKWITKTYPGIAENTEMGMAHMTRWYKSQYMLNNTTQLFTLSPSDDSFLNWASNSVNTSFGSDVLVLTGNSRLAFVRFDLGEIEGNINSATLKLTNGTTNNPNMMVRYIPDERDNWDENTLTYNSWCDANGGEMWLGDIFREFKPGGLNNTASIDVTELAKKEKAECDGILSMQIDRDTFPYPVGFYSKENTTPAAAGRQICLAVETDIQDKERFDEKYNDIKNKAEKMISEAKGGTDTGCYPKQYIDGLKTAFEELLSVYASGDSLLAGKSMVKVYDAMHDMRQNQVLRSDIDSLSTLFLTGSEMTGLAAKIQKSATLTNEYNIIKQMSDEDNMTAVDRLQWFVDDLPMDQICTYFKFYSSSGNLIFTPPSNTAYGTLEIYLPSTNYENSETGDIGHIWIDTVKIAVSGEDDIPIENSDFETGVGMPDYWETVSYSGNPVFKWETRPNYVDAGNASMYIENPTNQDCGGIRYTEKLPLYAGISHTLTFRTKIDKRFVDRGIVARITYYDKNDNVISVLEKEGNVKSGKGNVLQYAQADAIVYAVEGDPYYAEKCKKRLLFSLNDFCQGAEYWMVKGGRPDGIDAYGEVQGGRIMASACAAYTLIKDADVFSEDEMKRFADMIEYLAYFIMDIRDRTEDEFSRATQGSNWQTDMACGAGMYGMTFPEAPHSRQFLTNGALVIYGHMQNQLYDDGSWPESSRYLSSVINKFAPFAVAIGNARGDDWFAETKLPKVFEHLINIQTPPYIYFNGKIGTPPVGDDTLKEQGAFAALGIYSEKINSINPKLAAAMRKTWLKSGSPMNTYASEAISMQNFFTGTSGDIYEESVEAPGDYLSENIGQYIFRENSGTDREKFFDIISNKSALGHGHYDQGSFIFYANGLPLVMDPGIDGYFNSTKRWYTGSSSHACLLFAKNGDYLNTPTTSRADGVICSDELNAMRVTVDYGADGKHERSFALLEDGFGAVIIWDRVTGAGGETVFNMPVTAKKSEISGNTVYSTGYYGTDLKTTVLQPQKTDITTRWGPSTEFMPKISGGYKQNYVMSRAQKNENHLVVLEALKSGGASLDITELDTGIPDVSAYRLQKLNGGCAFAVTNGSASKKVLTVESADNLIDLKTGKTYTARDGKVSVDILPQALTILKSEAVETPAAASVEIVGNGVCDIPTAGFARKTFSANVLSQYGNVMEKEPVWSISGCEGVSIDKNTGTVTVSSTVQPYGIAVISAQCDGVSKEKNVTFVPAQSKRTSLEITGPESAALKNGENTVVSFTAAVYDQYGKQLDDNIVWEVSGDDGAYIKDGILTIPYDTPLGTVLSVTARSAGAMTVFDTKNIIVEKAAQSNIKLDCLLAYSPPSSGVRRIELPVIITDKNGEVFGNQTADMRILNNPDGVWLEGTVLNISAEAADGTEILIEAVSRDNPIVSGVFTITVQKGIPEKITVYGEQNINAPQSGSAAVNYSAKVFDFDGNELNLSVKYSADKLPSGVRLDENSGAVTVYSTAESGKFTLTAFVSGAEYIKDSIKVNITAAAKNPSAIVSGGGGGGSGVTSSPAVPSGENTNKPKNIFADVTESHWAYEIINELYNKRIVNGASDGNFYPDADVTRAEFVKMLVQSDNTEVKVEKSFKDVPETAWYYGAVSKAAALGLVNGDENGCFSPDDKITREDIACIIYRALGADGEYEASFTDKDDISDYAENAVFAMKALGIVSGYPDGSFLPKQHAARAEAAAFVYRYMNYKSDRSVE